MFFSIIIPTYQRAEIIRETLSSVMAQTFTDYEVVVVDDGSKDNTREIVSNFNHPAIKYFYKENEERSIARNYGADQAKGEYLIFLDSDDKMDKGHLQAIYEFINRTQPKPQFIFSGYKIINPDNSILYEYGMDGYFPRKKLFYGNFLGCSSVTVAAQLFKKYYFNTDRNIILFEDWELWLRIIAANNLSCFSNRSIVMMNHTGRSVLNYTPPQMDKRIFHFRKLVLNEPDLHLSFFNRQTFLMGIYSYAALHLAITKKYRAAALKYLALALVNNPLLIFKRRFFGIIKQLL